MKTKKNQSAVKTTTLEELKDRYIGPIGSEEREAYENELSMALLGKAIRSTRQFRNLTQEELGKLLGVQKAQISKLETSTNNASIDTIVKVFRALNAEIYFNVKIQ
jgi:DNA-binding XRE family transcriptional regulator